MKSLAAVNRPSLFLMQLSRSFSRTCSPEMSEPERDCQRCGAVFSQHISTVLCGNSCPECARYAYFSDQLSYLYLLTNAQLKLHKIGIGTVGKDKNRMEQLISEGWTAHGLWHDGSTRKVFSWEQEIFTQVKARLLSDGREIADFTGRWEKNWSESIDAAAISVLEIAKLISKIVALK
jgi:hypothetical protein